MTISNLSLLEKDIFEQLIKSHGHFLNDHSKEIINQKALELKNKLSLDLVKDNPFKEQEYLYYKMKRELKYLNIADLQSIESDLKYYKEIMPELDTSFWINHRLKMQKDQKKNHEEIDALIRMNIQESWFKDLNKKKLDWELKKIEEQRNLLINQIKIWLDHISKILETLKEFNLGYGILWDLSLGNLIQQDISIINELVDYLNQNKEIKELCDLLGRMKNDFSIIEKIKVLEEITYSVPTINPYYKEEIIGITFSRNIADILPQELSFLTEPTLSYLFDLKFIENRLLAFDKQGIEQNDVKIEREKIIENHKQNKGPMIICVDTSGSMAGAPEKIAKALTFLIATQAHQENRNCYLINFSTKIETMDFSKDKKLSHLLSFLKKSFHGGTDVMPAIHEGVHKMNSENYKNADLLVISDFILNMSDHVFIEKVSTQRSNGNRFFALSIGQFHLNQTSKLFDQQWIYDPNIGNLRQLSTIVQQINTKAPSISSDSARSPSHSF